jgi:hypothetical protein
MEEISIVVWVCPTKGCKHYYASRSVENIDLGKEEVMDLNHREVVGNRGECPECKQLGVSVQRVPGRTTILKPREEDRGK